MLKRCSIPIKFLLNPLSEFSTSLKLPIIDLSCFLTPSSSQSTQLVSQQIADSSEKYGVFLIKNHPLQSKPLHSSMKAFFSLSESQKAQIKCKSQGFTRGYIGMGEESGSDSYEVKEAFSYGYNWLPEKTPENPLQGLNIWPESHQLPMNFREILKNSFRNMCEISEALSKGYSLSLGYPENYLGDFCRKGDTISLMRLFHYFPYNKAPENTSQMKKIGSSEHTDWGFLTVILQENDVPGLQVFYESEWRDVEPIENTLVVNCGDYLSLLTGGRYISPLHRVVSEGKERCSAVFFYYPDYDARIPLLNNDKRYSLFKEQRMGGKGLKLKEIEEKSFGEYINEKWTQVAREGKMY